MHVDLPRGKGPSPEKIPQAVLYAALRRIGISSSGREVVLAARLGSHRISSAERITKLAR